MKRIGWVVAAGAALTLGLPAYAEASGGDLEAVLAITIFGMPFPLLVIGISIYKILRRRYERDIYKAAIDKGLPVPDMPQPQPADPRKAALVLIALGTGYFIATVVTVGLISKPDAVSPLQVAIWGIIPVLIGLALLYYDRMVKREGIGTSGAGELG